MELPSYRIPSGKSVLLHMWEKAKDFIRKAFTIIFLAAIVIWFLQSFDLHLNPVSDASQSILAAIGSVIAPIFIPLGFVIWQASTSADHRDHCKRNSGKRPGCVDGRRGYHGVDAAAFAAVYAAERVHLPLLYAAIYAVRGGFGGCKARDGIPPGSGAGHDGADRDRMVDCVCSTAYRLVAGICVIWVCWIGCCWQRYWGWPFWLYGAGDAAKAAVQDVRAARWRIHAEMQSVKRNDFET